nr:hypothetical protein [Tanacetum cinerariifolium]
MDYHGESDLPPPPPVIDNTRQPQMSDMTTCLNDLGYIPLNNEQNEPTQGNIGETSNDPTQAKRNEFEELYASANKELYPGCDYVTRLDFMEKFIYFKAKGKLTDSIFNEILEFFQNVFPTAKGYKLPPLYYKIKKTFKTIGLGYESIHTCVNDCFLFRGDANKDVHFCPMQHPVDGRAWKDFDTKYLDFVVEPRNVLLGLAADGFNPFDNLSQSYSMWPVILTTYNLPPWLCIKAKLGVETIDVATGLKFNMRVMVLWTNNDFPSRSSLSGWSGQGYKACPTCNEDTLSVRVLGKTTYVGHKRFLKKPHKWMRSLEFNGETKNGDPPREFNRDAIMTQLARLPTCVKVKHPRCHAYRKECVGEYLEYFVNALSKSALKLNVLESILNTLLMNDKSKDTTKIRQRHADNDPGVNESSELFALACGPSQTLISVNSCVINGVRFVVHNRDERRTTQNNGICSPGPDGEMYYALHIDGQSIDVDAPPDIIDVVDEDDDIIDEENSIPHDLADSDDEDLVNLDIDDGVNQMSHGVTALTARVVAKIGTQFDLRPHMEFDRWPQIYAGIQQHLQKIYNGKKAALK